MEKFLETVKTTDIIGVFLAISALYLIIILVKRDKGRLTRGLALALILLAAFIFFSQNPKYKVTLAELRNQMFPASIPPIYYQVTHPRVGNVIHTVYRFDPPFPRLSVRLDKRGEYFIILNPESVNRVLRQLNLPEVEGSCRELIAITRDPGHVSLFQWENYALGSLLLQKDFCLDKEGLLNQHCIVRITIIPKH